ncbi:MAG: tRNA (adenosine(37)-N6)-threonylcarbamoyltransferase complex dimerization subunit type 1 TsaB [Propionibacteriaceae bacterium]|jgi:tRNA threonylcarbamoyl adenosine modification protein YeaZ|nr:tRNA (adenosine(37)-N6)-threonylcarbamoyltransferase complex dimerization subunit type 1 TsaB [Propionibacteriaceae bacterium]
MSIVLGIDTSQNVSVGLAVAGKIAANETIMNTRAHVEELTPLTQRVLAQAGVEFGDLDSIVVGVGPGPFTGLRVGVASATVLAEILRIPVKGVCSLDVLARQIDNSGAYSVVSDARRKELYWGTYNAGKWVSGPFVSAPDMLPALPVFGTAVDLYEMPGQVLGKAEGVDAGLMALLADELPEAGLEPLYLRRPDAEVSTKHKSALVTRRRR